jgi:hypothetical protein
MLQTLLFKLIVLYGIIVIFSNAFSIRSNRATTRFNQKMSSTEKFYTLEEVELFGFKSGIYLKPVITGPALKLEAYVKDDLDNKIGYLTAFIRPFPFGLLQLETIQVLNRRQTLGFKRDGWSVKGPGICFIMGSWALKWAYDKVVTLFCVKNRIQYDIF